MIKILSSEKIPNDDSDQNSIKRSELITVKPTGLIRSQRVANLQIQPFQPNYVFTKIVFEMQFDPSFNSINSTQTPRSPHFESFFRSILLNYDQALDWRVIEKSTPSAPTQFQQPKDRFKIVIEFRGIYKITSDDFRVAKFDPSQVDLKTIKMESQGTKIGVHVFDVDRDGKLDPKDQIIFYGEPLVNNKFTEKNVYWISWENPDHSIVSQLDVTPKAEKFADPIAFKTTEHFEKNLRHDPLTDEVSEFADHYFWSSLTGGPIESARQKVIPIELPHAIPRTQIFREAELRIRFQGISTKKSAIHRARIRLSGKALIPVIEWRRQGAPLVIRTVNQRTTLHHDSTNYLIIIAEDDNGTPVTKPDFYLDWFELDYWRTFAAVRDELFFNSDTEPRSMGRHVRFKIENFTRPNIDLYRIRNGSITAKLENPIVEKTRKVNPRYSITFEDFNDLPSDYVAVAQYRYRSIPKLIQIKPKLDLRDPGNRADYIIISHKNFISNIQPLADFRSSQGLNVKIIDVDEIYDTFSHGVFNPHAIQKFLRFTYTNWQKPEPTYVLLVGDAHYDYKHSTVKFFKEQYNKEYKLYPNFVPTYHGWAPESGETAMDDRFTQVSGDDALPDMFIGRLAVQFPYELDAMVKKIIAYETDHPSGLWQAKLVHVSDNAIDNPGQDEIFEKSREELINEIIPVAYDTKRIYLSQTVSPKVTKRMIADSINDGTIILEYAGHGSSKIWADEAIFRIEDVQSLRNKILPFVITTTCLNGQFDKPLQFGDHCLSEQFLLGPHGAIANLSATRLTYGSANADFDRELFQAMLVERESDPQMLTVGAMIGKAKSRFISWAPSRWIPGAEQYTLFGDPATRLRLPEAKINFELESIVVDPDQSVHVKSNTVGTEIFDPSTGEFRYEIDRNFNSENMQISAIFPPIIKEEASIKRNRNKIRIWQGEFGDLQIPVPSDAGVGDGLIRAFALDGDRAAIGGTRFSVYQPIIVDVRDKMDHLNANTLEIFAHVVDNNGSVGIANVKVNWLETQEFTEHETSMIIDKNPTQPTLKNGAWYKLEKPIPLPKGGRAIRYTISVMDKSGNKIETDQYTARVPEGANISIANYGTELAPIRYEFSKELDQYLLTADLVNTGGKPIPVPIEVWFSEDNPDVNGDQIIEPETQIYGSVTVSPNEWETSEIYLQKVTATLILSAPLSTGHHKIYAFADPESDDDDHDDRIFGKLDEPRSFDNKGFSIFVVNTFVLRKNEPLTAASLDHVFTAEFKSDSLTGVPEVIVAIDEFQFTKSFQPDLSPAPTPRNSGLGGAVVEEIDRVYQINLQSKQAKLEKSVRVQMHINLDQIGRTVTQKYQLFPKENGFDRLLLQEAAEIAIYNWRSELSAWQKLPSELSMTIDESSGKSELIKENFVSPTRSQNTSKQILTKSDIRVDPNLTPPGRWLILFISPYQYEIMLLPKGSSRVEKLGKTGRTDNVYQDAVLGLEIQIKSGGGSDFEFGDTFGFETAFSVASQAEVTTIRSKNFGNGKAFASISKDHARDFTPGDWLIFFLDGERFEVRDKFNSPLRYEESGSSIIGRINQPIAIRPVGIDILVNSADLQFQFGDTIKFSTSLVGVLSTEISGSEKVALLYNSDRDAPELKIWVDGVAQPYPESVIAPRPKISILIEDSNGTDLDSLSFEISKNDGDFEPIKNYEIRQKKENPQSALTQIPIYYNPILFIGRYKFRLSIADLNGNVLNREFIYNVREDPDLSPPTFDLIVDGETLTDRMILRSQPTFEIEITDDKGLDPKTIELLFESANLQIEIVDHTKFDFEFDREDPMTAKITFAPDLTNGEYQIQVRSGDINENVAESPIANFTFDEPIEIGNVLNVPNPMRDRTFFTYNLVQPPENVEIRIYTINGRLIRKIETASAERGYNETYWDGRDQEGIRVANGTYFYRVLVETGRDRLEEIRRLAVLR